MTHGISLDDIDPFHPSLLREQTVALLMGKDKVNRYIAKGLTREAQGARTIVQIMWQSFMNEIEIDTGWGEI